VTAPAVVEAVEVVEQVVVEAATRGVADAMTGTEAGWAVVVIALAHRRATGIRETVEREAPAAA
jgi:hypothetical protein